MDGPEAAASEMVLCPRKGRSAQTGTDPKPGFAANAACVLNIQQEAKVLDACSRRDLANACTNGPGMNFKG